MNKDIFIITLQKKLNDHRRRSLICCDEKCFCWEVETLLTKTFKGAKELNRNQGIRMVKVSFRKCPICKGEPMDLDLEHYKSLSKSLQKLRTNLADLFLYLL